VYFCFFAAWVFLVCDKYTFRASLDSAHGLLKTRVSLEDDVNIIEDQTFRSVKLEPGRVYKFDASSFINATKVVSTPPREQFVVSDAFELLYCYIPKNGCTKMKSLFLRLASSTAAYQSFGTIHTAFSQVDSVRASKLPEHRLKELSSHQTWIRAIVLRDPMERFVSAYLDKIADRKSLRFFHLGDLTFSANGVDLGRFMALSHVWKWEPHFKLQHLTCGFNLSMKFWNRILVYDASSDLANLTAELFEHRIDYAIYHGWGPNLTMWSEGTVHATGSTSKRSKLISEMCANSTLYGEVYKYVEPDYQFFNFAQPTLCARAF